MTARLAITDADLDLALDRLAAAGFNFVPDAEERAKLAEHPLRRWERGVVLGDGDAMIMARVERGKRRRNDAIWLEYILGPPESWAGLILAICRMSQERGTDKLPIYRLVDLGSPIWKTLGDFASDRVGEPRKDGKILLRTTIPRILKALGEPV